MSYDLPFLRLLLLVHIPVPVELEQDDGVDCEGGGVGCYHQHVLGLLEGGEYPGGRARPVEEGSDGGQLSCGAIHVCGGHLR